MLEPKEKILVIGAGAIGGITAAFLTRGGFPVQLVTKYTEPAEQISMRGLQISGARGEFIQKIPAVATLREVDGQFNWIFIATKATDMLQVAKEIYPFLSPSGRVVSLQNGICEDALGEIVGRERTIGCVVGWGATMHQPGEVEMTSTGEFVIGRLDGELKPELEFLADALGEVVPTLKTQNIYGHLYSKLIINSCITTLGALTGLTLGKLLARRRIRQIFIRIMKEGVDVANALQIKVEPFAGKLDYYRFFKNPGLSGQLYRHLFIILLGIKYRRLKSSSLQSLERGKPTEIDYFNGYIAARGKETGVDTPVNDILTRMVKEIEHKKRNIQPENLLEVLPAES